MKKSILSSALLIALLFVTAFNAFSQSEEELKVKIEKMNAKMVKAMLAGDHEMSLAYYVDDAISLPSYQPMLKGKEAIAASAKEASNSPMKITSFELHTKKIEVCGDMVIEIGKYSMAFTMPNMPEPATDKGKYITIWEKQTDGSLKIKIDTWNSDINPWNEMNKEKEM